MFSWRNKKISVFFRMKKAPYLLILDLPYFQQAGPLSLPGAGTCFGQPLKHQEPAGKKENF